MIVTCETCGKKYQVQPERINGDSARFKCKGCGAMVSVTNPQKKPSPEGLVLDSQPAPSPAKPAQVLSDSSLLTDLDTISQEEPKGFSAQEPPVPVAGIRSKLIVSMIIVIAFTLALAGMIAGYFSRTALTTRGEQYLLLTAQLKAKEYGLVLERIKAETGTVASLTRDIYAQPDITGDVNFDMLRPWTGTTYGSPELESVLTPERLKLQRVGLALKHIVANNPHLELGYVASESGLMVFNDVTVIPEFHKLNAFIPSVRPWYKKAKAEGRVVWVEPYVDPSTKKLTISSSSPIFNIDNQFLGVVGFDIRLETIQKDLLSLNVGHNSYAMLVTKTGTVLLRPKLEQTDERWDPSLKNENLLETGNTDLTALTKSMVGAKIPGIGTFTFDGATKYLAYAPIPALGISIALVADKAEILEPARHILYALAGICALGLVLAFIGVSMVSRLLNPPRNR